MNLPSRESNSIFVCCILPYDWPISDERGTSVGKAPKSSGFSWAACKTFYHSAAAVTFERISSMFAVVVWMD